MPEGPLPAQPTQIPYIGHLSAVLRCVQFAPSCPIMYLPFTSFKTSLSGIFVPAISLTYPLMINILPSLFLATAPRCSNLLVLTARTPISMVSLVASLRSIIVVVAQNMNNFSDKLLILPLLDIFCSSNCSLSCVTSRLVLRVSWYIAFLSEDIAPKSLELLALQRLCKKISNHLVGPAVFNLHVSLHHLIGYKEVANV
jgi:hypothetical protein